MVKVIRSAYISDRHVALPVQRPIPIPSAGAVVGLGHQPVLPIKLEPDLESSSVADGLLQQDQRSDSAEAIWASVREHEQRLKDRERNFEEELEGVRRRAREDAYSDGYKLGEAEAMNEYRSRLDALQRLIDSCKEEFAKELSGLEDVVVEIVFESVCKIVGASLHEKDGVIAVVREVMACVKDQERLTIHVSPQDYRFLYQNRDELFGAGQDAKHELVPDDRVALGGCLIETSGGTLDGRLEMQLQQLRDTLISARRMLPE